MSRLTTWPFTSILSLAAILMGCPAASTDQASTVTSTSAAPSATAHAASTTSAEVPTGSAQPALPAPSLSADGSHFAEAVSYQGECAPKGSRGGCYALAFEPGGSFKEMLLDAIQSGAYVIEGDKLTLTYPAQSDTKPKTLHSTDKFSTLSNGFRRVAPSR